jgi:hypothetical protein
MMALGLVPILPKTKFLVLDFESRVAQQVHYGQMTCLRNNFRKKLLRHKVDLIYVRFKLDPEDRFLISLALFLDTTSIPIFLAVLNHLFITQPKNCLVPG